MTIPGNSAGDSLAWFLYNLNPIGDELDPTFEVWYNERGGHKTHPDKKAAFELWESGDGRALLLDYIARNYKACPLCLERGKRNIWIAPSSKCCTVCEGAATDRAEIAGLVSAIDCDAFTEAPRRIVKPGRKKL